MKVGQISGSGAMPDFILRSGSMLNHGRTRVQPQRRTVRVNDTEQKEKGGTSTMKNREPPVIDTWERSQPH